MNKSALILFLVLFKGFCAWSQEVKEERETFITREQTPTTILEVLDPLMENVSSVKYLQETDGSHESYEVKFRLSKKQYSIEFSKDSQLEDVEVDIDQRSLSRTFKTRMDSLYETFQNHKTQKIQKQYSPDGQSDHEIIQSALQDGSVGNVRYEIEVSLKSEGHWEDFELLFDSQGYLLSQRRIIKRESDFIDFR